MMMLFSLLAVLVGVSPLASAKQTSEELIGLWGTEPVESLSATRGRIVLNGLWRFQPAEAGEPPASSSDWGTIWVPGSWDNFWKMPGTLDYGNGPAWKPFNGKKLSKAWYERSFRVPAAWQGRAILLELTRVSTDAVVYANGVECGEVMWPAGEVDISKAVTPGEDAKVRILVTAAGDGKKLDARGIIGEVLLHSRPAGPHVSDVFVQTSTRRKELTLTVELSGVDEPGKVRLLARILDDHGGEEKKFKKTVTVEANPVQQVQVTWKWRRPRLWDLDQPNLYTLKLEVQGLGLQDEYPQEFGFREFWIEGRRFFLNGTEIRLRPAMCGEEVWSNAGGLPEFIDSVIDGFRWAGFNFQELWPWDHGKRGSVHFRQLWCDHADRKGWLLAGVALDMQPYIHDARWKLTWDQPEGKATWERKMLAELRRYRNHPSVVMWGTSANFFGHGEDQNPRDIGQRERLRQRGGSRSREAGLEGVAIIKRHDPTRPVFTHQGGPVGDLQTVNSYLNMIPLQEREEWLSDWGQHGDMPYLVVEFGTPLHVTFMRGRTSFPDAVITEPLMTEFCAIYLGREAYELEQDEYRQQVKDSFIKDQEYKNWQNDGRLDFAPAHQALQELFSRNTWRSWRTFGTTGGMVPWANGMVWRRTEAFEERMESSPFKPGRRGTYYAAVAKGYLNYLRPPETVTLPGGRAIMEANGPTLAWIAGPEAAFTAKDHHFLAGQRVEKQVAILNDTRERQSFAFTWTALVGGKEIALGKKGGRIASAHTKMIPFAFELPAKINRISDGEIRLVAEIGEARHEDQFAFRVFEPLPPVQQTVAVVDPVGLTSRLLEDLGCTLEPWDGKPGPKLVIIGRNAWSDGGA